jgi:hypothetical protein
MKLSISYLEISQEEMSPYHPADFYQYEPESVLF